jgi:hypothetical protein
MRPDKIPPFAPDPCTECGSTRTIWVNPILNADSFPTCRAVCLDCLLQWNQNMPRSAVDAAKPAQDGMSLPRPLSEQTRLDIP